MMAAIAAAGAGADVTLVEKNEKLGKKLFITGKGRCNLTNSCRDKELLSQIVSNPRFCYSAFSRFSVEDVCGFFEKNGCRLKEERGGRVFPASDHSSDVIKTLEKKLRSLGVEIKLNTALKAIKPAEEGFELRLSGTEGKSSVFAKTVIMATGGASYPATGSDGSSYKLLEGLGHSLREPAPALAPFTVKEVQECKSLQGLALKNVELCLYDGKKKLYSERGELLYTHFGLSGPLVLSASSYYRSRPKINEAKLTIDLKPALSRDELDARILRDFEENKNKNFANVLGGFLPSSMCGIFPERCGIPGEKKIHEITRQERAAFLESLKCLTYTVTGTRGFEEAIITAGGVKVKEVDPSTMGSKTVPGLYLAGELLDVDALTGGFNLQIAWSTGYLAGISAAERMGGWRDFR